MKKSVKNSEATSWEEISSQMLPDDEEGIISRIEELLQKDEPMPTVRVNSSNKPDLDKNDIWFFGDIHGDLLGMTMAIDYVKKISKESSKKTTIIYLGDFFDYPSIGHYNKCTYGHWVLVKLFLQILDNSHIQIGVIAGNHDEGLKHSKERGFYSEVKPCEFAGWLNDQPEDSVWQKLGKVAIRFFKRMPRAIFMPDGLLIAHGDKRIWEKKLNHPIQRVLKGHEHYQKGFEYTAPPYKKYPTLGLNTRCYKPLAKNKSNLCVARWIKGELPEVHIIPVPKEYIDRAYSKPIKRP